jgi:Phosphotransferase enzyme family
LPKVGLSHRLRRKHYAAEVKTASRISAGSVTRAVAAIGRADLADPALAQQIATRFGLGGVVGQMRSVSRPDEMGRRWLLETDRGRWAPRTVDDVFPVTDGEDNARFQEAAAQAGVTVPASVRSGSGAVVEVIAGSRWRVYEWLQSGPPLAAPVNATITHAVGEILATIHGLRVPVDGSAWAAVSSLPDGNTPTGFPRDGRYPRRWSTGR